MNAILPKLPFLIELIFSAPYIMLYILSQKNRIPSFIKMEDVQNIFAISEMLLPLMIFVTMLLQFVRDRSFEIFLRRHVLSLITIISLLITWGDSDFLFWLISIHLTSTLFDFFGAKKKKASLEKEQTLMERLQLKSASLFIYSFFFLILGGSLLLVLPFAAAPGEKITYIDALFMSTSAVCVTGLATISVSDNMSTFGQIVLLFLVQVGGLGVMTLTSSMSLFLGRSMGVKQKILMQDILDFSSQEELTTFIGKIVKYTFTIEMIGAAILTIGFRREGLSWWDSVYNGMFHAISAFCNAGFALYNNNLEDFNVNPIIHGTVAILIILGGIGFVVMREVREGWKSGRGFKYYSLHTKISIITTFLLIFSGMLIIFFSEFLYALDQYTLWEKMQIAFFQSVTLRTAGFNSIPFNNLQAYTLYIMIIYMFIGASPGSTGGGIKTTTFAVLIQSLRSLMRGRENLEFFGRSVSMNTTIKATALTILSLTFISCASFYMLFFEPRIDFLSLLFEIVSAFGTVGLSVGITASLSVMGKIGIILMMFIGRIGPLTLAQAIYVNDTEKQGQYSYPEGRVMIG